MQLIIFTNISTQTAGISVCHLMSNLILCSKIQKLRINGDLFGWLPFGLALFSWVDTLTPQLF